MFLLPTPTYFTDSQKTLYYSISQSRLTPSSADPCSAPSWLHPYSCLRPFLKKASMSIPPSLLRVTITLDLGLISHIRRFRTFKSLKAFGAALRLPSQSPDIVRVSHRRGRHLTTPGHYKAHHIYRWNPFQRHHRVSPGERSTSERLVFDTSSISQRVSPWIQLCTRCHKITLKTQLTHRRWSIRISKRSTQRSMYEAGGTGPRRWMAPSH